MKWVFFCLIGLSAISAVAADYTAGTKCPVEVMHQPNEDVEYQPGVDAKGYAVAPAEEVPPALSKESFGTVGIPLEIAPGDAGQNGNLAAEERLSRSNLRPGNVEVDVTTGETRFNGQTLNSVTPTETNPDCWSVAD